MEIFFEIKIYTVIVLTVGNVDYELVFNKTILFVVSNKPLIRLE